MSSTSSLHSSIIRRRLPRLVSSFVALLVAVFAFAGAAFAAVEVNSADQSQLESVKGIGPALSGKILTARKTGAFKDWPDLQSRVSGIGEKNSLAFSRNGLTVSGRGKVGAEAADGTTATPRAGRPGSKKAADAGTTTVASSQRK